MLSESETPGWLIQAAAGYRDRMLRLLRRGAVIAVGRYAWKNRDRIIATGRGLRRRARSR
jgi:hypothetical protein